MNADEVGTLRQRRPEPSDRMQEVIRDKGMVFIRMPKVMLSLPATAGKPRWSDPAPQPDFSCDNIHVFSIVGFHQERPLLPCSPNLEFLDTRNGIERTGPGYEEPDVARIHRFLEWNNIY